MSQVRTRSIETSVLLAGILHGAVAAGLYALFLGGDGAYAVGPHVSALWLAVAFGGCEFIALRVERLHGESYGFTLALVPLAAGLAYSTPAELVAARLVGVAVALAVVVVVPRQRKVREAIYELAVHSLQVVVPIILFRGLIGSADVVSAQGAFALLVALLASFALASVALTVCIGFVQGRIPNRHTISAIWRTSAVAALLNAGIGIGLAAALWEHPNVLVVLTAIALAGIACNRAYRGLLHKYKGLETHYDFVSSVVRSTQLSEISVSVLDAARKLLRADDAVLLLRPVDDGEPARRVRLGDAGRELAEASPAQHQADLRALMPGAEPCRVVIDDSTPGWLRALTTEHAMAAPLTSTDRTVVGALVVTQARRKVVSSFGNADAELLGTLATQASIAIENGILFHRLGREAAERAHQASHDPVTGLPNRARFEDLVGRTLDAAYPTRGRVGLLVVDLESFGQVVDAFGHASADGLLIQACGRIRGLVPEAAVLARLSGEQFAIVLPEVGDSEEVIRVARLLIAGFDPPFQSEGVLLALSVNVGIAVYPEQAIDVPSLVQRAHIAADVASRHRSGWEVYDPTQDPSTPRRLALAADLREALETEGLDVCFQPKVELATGIVRGAEALVRWNHPRLGRVRPDEFIAIAEHTGDIRALTMIVMRRSLAECRGWRDLGLDMGVAVNLSARNLLDLHLVDDVAAAIDEAGVPPSALTLELTESVVMSESQRSIDVLSGLNDLGVRLSCDDFGTGYSSLAHLRRLPICEIKIDKSFIASIAVDESDRAIARSVLTLGRDLGLATVAEGVESREGWDLLTKLGCDQAQGFVVCPPLTGPQFGDWLGRRPPDEFAYLDDRYAEEIAAYQRRMLPSITSGSAAGAERAAPDRGEDAGDAAEAVPVEGEPTVAASAERPAIALPAIEVSAVEAGAVEAGAVDAVAETDADATPIDGRGGHRHRSRGGRSHRDRPRRRRTRRGSDERPGVAAARVVDRERPGDRHLGRPLDERGVLVGADQPVERRRAALVGQPDRTREQVVGHRLPGEVPDHRAQLGLAVERQPVVDRPHAPVVAREAVAALAVGAVGEQVEAADRAQGVVAGRLLEQREVVRLDVERHEPLQRPHPERQAVAAQHGLGHHVPAEPGRQLVRRDLPPIEAGGEVPQGSLALARLVYGPQAAPIVRDLDEQGGVRAPGHAPEDLDLAGPQDVEHPRRVELGVGGRGQFIRGHEWPSGSIGRPQKAQSGRPWVTRSSAKRPNALAWGSVKQNRAVAGFSDSSASSSRTTTMRRSGSSYFTPIDPTSQANGSGVTAPGPSAASTSGDRSSSSASRYSPSAATCCFSHRR